MRNICSFIFILVLSMNTWSEEPVNCSEPTEHAKMYFGSISKMEFGKIVDFKALLKNNLISHAREVERVVNLGSKYTGPDSEYIPRLIDLLAEPAGGRYEASCLWGLHKDGDYIQEFSEDESMVFRKGYGLFRDGVLIAYYYSEIAVV